MSENECVRWVLDKVGGAEVCRSRALIQSAIQHFGAEFRMEIKRIVFEMFGDRRIELDADLKLKIGSHEREEA